MTTGLLAIDGFDNREFSVEELTLSMNVVPNMYTMVTDLGIFGTPQPLSTTYCSIEIDNMTLNLLPAIRRGGPATKDTAGKRKRRLFEIPLSAHEDMITVADIQNMRGFGGAAPKMLEDEVNRRLFQMTLKHQITHEWRRIGALKGQVLDSDGGVMLDLFTEFGVTQKVIAFGGASSINQYIVDTKRHIEDNLVGDVMMGVGCLASQEFMDMIMEDAEVKAAYNAAAAMMRLNPNIDDVRPAFSHKGVLFMEYRGQAGERAADGSITTRRFIPAGDARFFPIGTMQSAVSFTAPGDFFEAANLPGQLYYAKAASGDKWNRTLELHTQSAFLPLWTRPATLVRGHTGSS